MSDIFEESLIYPLNVKYKAFFRDYYDSVFVDFMPFFKVDEVKRSWLWRMTASEEDLKFPSDKDIYERGAIVSWDRVIKEAGFKDEKELCKALETCYGGYYPVFRRDDQMTWQIFFGILKKNKIFHVQTKTPSEFFQKFRFIKLLNYLIRTSCNLLTIILLLSL